jgi:hypothetical protein
MKHGWRGGSDILQKISADSILIWNSKQTSQQLVINLEIFFQKSCQDRQRFNFLKFRNKQTYRYQIYIYIYIYQGNGWNLSHGVALIISCFEWLTPGFYLADTWKTPLKYNFHEIYKAWLFFGRTIILKAFWICIQNVACQKYRLLI